MLRDLTRIIFEFHQYMKSIGISESYQNGNLKVIIYFARFLGSATDFLCKKERADPFFSGYKNKRYRN